MKKKTIVIYATHLYNPFTTGTSKAFKGFLLLFIYKTKGSKHLVPTGGLTNESYEKYLLAKWRSEKTTVLQMKLEKAKKSTKLISMLLN